MIVIEKYYEVIKKLLELLNTLEEGITYIHVKINEPSYEESLAMLQDVMEGIESITEAIVPMMSMITENSIKDMTTILKENISKAIGSCEDGKEINFKKQVEEEVLPAFKNWKEELEKIFKFYIIS